MRPGRSSASSSASGMFVAIMTRIRYFGGGFGRMPSIRRPHRLTSPRGFFSPDSSVSSACSVPMPPPPPAIAAHHEPVAAGVGAGSGGAELSAVRGEQRSGCRSDR